MVTRLSKRGLQKILSGQVKEPTKCIIKFYNARCHYCHALKPIYDILSDEFGDINFFAFNVGDYPEIEKILEFEGVPSICMVECGWDKPRRRFINEPVDPDKKMWYTGDNIRNFLREF